MSREGLEALDSADALLRRFLEAEDATAAQQCLETLLAEHAESVIRNITRVRMRACYTPCGSHDASNEEDIRSEVLLQLISRLHALKKDRNALPIQNFRSYVAVTTYNAHYKHLRMKYPARWRLKNRIRYLLSHRREFTLWETEQLEWVCGLAIWGGDQARTTAHPENEPALAGDFLDSLPPGKSVTKMKTPDLVENFLAWRGRAILLDELVGHLAELLGVSDPQAATTQEEGEAINLCDLLPDPSVDIASQVERRLYLQRLWGEIGELPPRQRQALLLNLRDMRDRDALILFSLTGIANLRQIALMIEMPLEELAVTWKELPLRDATIAEKLGITRQQVINLRKSARERLARRMA